MIGIMCLGMLLGIVAGAIALFAGHSILMALLLYSSIGTLFVLLTILMLAAVSGLQRHNHGQHSY